MKSAYCIAITACLTVIWLYEEKKTQNEQAEEFYRFARRYLQEHGYTALSMRRFTKGAVKTKAVSCGYENTLSVGCGGRSYLGPLHFCTPYQVRQRAYRENFILWCSTDYSVWRSMIHAYYQEAMAKLSRLPLVECVGIQSNFSFDVETFMARLQENNADITKLRLWGTFHPEMTSIEKFRVQCISLKDNGIQFSVGIVGVTVRNSTGVS